MYLLIYIVVSIVQQKKTNEKFSAVLHPTAENKEFTKEYVVDKVQSFPGFKKNLFFICADSVFTL